MRCVWRPRRKKQEYHPPNDPPFQYDPNRKSLLDLPPEIWSRIGHLLILSRPKYTQERIHAAKWKTKKQLKMPYQPAITLVCRVLREELLPLWYKNNVTLYQCRYLTDILPLVGKWLRAVPNEYCKLIGQNTVELVGGIGELAAEVKMKKTLGVDLQLELVEANVGWNGLRCETYRIVFL